MHLNLPLSTLTRLLHGLLVLSALGSSHGANDEDTVVGCLAADHSVRLVVMGPSHAGYVWAHCGAVMFARAES